MVRCDALPSMLHRVLLELRFERLAGEFTTQAVTVEGLRKNVLAHMSDAAHYFFLYGLCCSS